MIFGHPKKLFLSRLIIFEQGCQASFHDLHFAEFYHNVIFNSQSVMSTLSYMKYIGDIHMILFDEHFMDVERSFLLRLNLTFMLSSTHFIMNILDKPSAVQYTCSARVTQPVLTTVQLYCSTVYNIVRKTRMYKLT